MAAVNRRRWSFGLVLFLLPTVLLAKPREPIEVQVEITEVDRSEAAELGIDWINTAQFREGKPAGVVSLGAIDRLTRLQADLNFLIQEGAAELLANPNLITDSGTTAEFQAGGQLPYITSSSLGTTHVEFKPYGVFLSIKPRLLASGLIRLNVKARISSPDQTNAVILSGNAVPALLERQVKSNLTVLPGTTMTLAGLVQTQKEELERGVPFLRKIPLLGAFFRWRKINYRRTSIIMFVTPKLLES